MSVRILLVDDHQLVREGLRVLLEREQFQVVGEASDGRDAIRMAETVPVDVAVLDLDMPKLNGLDAAREICRATPGSKVVALTTHTEDAYVISALRAGIKGYVLKSQAGADLVHAINEVSRGMPYFSPGISGGRAGVSDEDGAAAGSADRAGTRGAPAGRRGEDDQGDRPRARDQHEDGRFASHPAHAQARHARDGQPRPPRDPTRPASALTGGKAATTPLSLRCPPSFR